jgi:hypothetical protein
MSRRNLVVSTEATIGMPDLDHAVIEVLRQHTVPRDRIVGGTGGAAVPVEALHRAVREHVGEPGPPDGQLEDAVNRLGGRRTNYSDAAGRILKLARRLGAASPCQDVYELPQSVISRPYHEPQRRRVAPTLELIVPDPSPDQEASPAAEYSVLDVARER